MSLPYYLVNYHDTLVFFFNLCRLDHIITEVGMQSLNYVYGLKSVGCRDSSVPEAHTVLWWRRPKFGTQHSHDTTPHRLGVLHQKLSSG